jgi:hypothetical protein
MCPPRASGHISASSFAVSLYPDFHRNLTPALGTGFKENPVMDPGPPRGTLLYPSIPVPTAFLLQDILHSRTLVHARNMGAPFLFGRLGPETRVPCTTSGAETRKNRENRLPTFRSYPPLPHFKELTVPSEPKYHPETP